VQTDDILQLRVKNKDDTGSKKMQMHKKFVLTINDRNRPVFVDNARYFEESWLLTFYTT